MSAERRKTRGLLLLGLLLLGAGVIFLLVPTGAGLTEWLMRLWPVFLICAGVVRVMGFAVERKPRSPVGGMLLIIIGFLFLASRFHSNLNALEIYGRYWLPLLGVFAAVELIRYYSHPHTAGPPPRLFTPWRVIVIIAIISTGVIANRIASAHPSLLSALKLPGFLSGIRDSVVGETYAFKDAPFESPYARPGLKITVNNSYGNVSVKSGGSSVRATLTKGVRAWSEEDARKIAEQIRLVVNQTSDGYSITTNRDQVSQQFTTDIQVEVPSPVTLAITDSYGSVIANGISGELIVKASQGRVEASGIQGRVSLSLKNSSVDASNIRGNVSVTGAKDARLSQIGGSLDLTANNGSIELREIAGPVHVDAPFSRINAQGLAETAELKTEHASIKLARAADVTIEAPRSDVQAENISGDLYVSSSHSQIQARNVSGLLQVEAEQSSVTAEDVRGQIVIDTSHGEVAVRNFDEGVTVRTSYRNVSLATAAQPAGDIDVENSHGEIKLALPPASEFQLDAKSPGGQVKLIGFNDIQQRAGDALSFGSYGPTIRLKTSYKNITIQASGARQTQASRLVD
jgi:DUF4097 and DUF4098 domain-containing protein YvlB